MAPPCEKAPGWGLAAASARIAGLTVALLALFGAPSLDAQQRLQVSGRLIDGRQGPVGNELVTLRRYPDSYQRRLYDLGGGLGEVIAEQRTDVDGRFALEVPAVGVWRLYLAEGSERVEPRRVDLAPLLSSVDLGEIELPATVPVPVRIADATGRWVVDAVVVADPGSAPDPRFRDRSVQPAGWRRATRTDDQGRALVRLPPGQAWIRAAHPDWLMQEREITVSTEAQEEILKLSSGRPRTLQVVTERGEVVAGAVVRMGEVQMPIGLTDEEGRIVVAGHEQLPVTYQIESRELGYGSVELSPQPSDASEDTPLQVVLEPPALLRGRVFDASRGDPVGGAVVWSRLRPSEYAFTTPEGDYELSTWDSRLGVTLGAAALGYAEGWMTVSASSLENQDIPTVGLTPTQFWRGRVFDSVGAGVARARLSFEAIGDLRNLARDRFLVESAGDGSFSVELPVGVEHRLVVTAGGHAPVSRRLRAVGIGELPEPLEIRLEQGMRLVGWVVDAQDVPLPGVQVRLVLEEGNGRARYYARSGDESQSNPFAVRAESDSEGRFVLEHAGVGRYLLAAELEGFAPARVPGIEVEEGARDFEVGTLVLGRGLSLKGRVFTSEGTSVVGAEVFLVDRDRFGSIPDSPAAVSDDAGRFEIGGLADGSTIELLIRHAGMAPSHYEGLHVPREEPLEVVLEPASGLIGRVVDRAGEAVPATRLWVDSATGLRRTRQEPLMVRSDDDGAFSFTGLAAGDWVLTASAEGWLEKELSLELAAGEVTPVEVTLERGATLVGTISDADGRGVSGAFLALRDDRYGGLSTSRVSDPSDAEGRFRVEGLPAEPVTVVVSHPRHPSATRTIDLSAGRGVLDVTLGEGASLVGVVLDSSGDPVAGARLTPLPQDGAFEPGPIGENPLTGRDGRFRLEGLAAGLWVAQAEPPDGSLSSSMQSEAIELRAGEEHWIELRLPRGYRIAGRVRGLDLDGLSRVDVYADRIDAAGTGTSFARPDYEGRFVLGPLAPGRWQVAARFDRRFVHAEIEVGPGQNDEVDLEFTEGLRLTGLVRSAGEPMIGASVRVFAETGSQSVATTDRNGAFVLEGLSSGSQMLMVAGRDGRAHQEHLQLEGDDHVSIEIDFRQLRGRVVSADSGGPILGARVGLGAGSALTDEDGLFQLSVSASESPILVVSHPGFARYQSPVSLEDEPFEISLEPTEELSLRVLRADGTELRRANVAWVGADGEAVWGAFALPDGQGRLTVSGVPRGRRLVWVMRVDQEEAAALIEVEIPGPPVDVVLPRAGMIEVEGSTLDGDGIVRLRHPANGALYPNAWPLRAGSASIGPVPAGRWIVMAEGVEVPVTVPTGGVARSALDVR